VYRCSQVMRGDSETTKRTLRFGMDTVGVPVTWPASVSESEIGWRGQASDRARSS
jgi:hypothetical protein